MKNNNLTKNSGHNADTSFKKFTKFTGKHLCQSLFLNKVAGLKPATVLWKETLAQVFSYEFSEILKNTYFEEHLQMAAFDDRRYLFHAMTGMTGVLSKYFKKD